MLEQHCQHSVDQSLQFLTAALDQIDAILPTVPPEEIHDLDHEERSIRALGDGKGTEERRTALENRRMYRLWKARRDLADAMTSVDQVTGNKRKREGGSGFVLPPSVIYDRPGANRLATMLNASVDIDYAAGSLRELLISQAYRQNSLLTKAQVAQLYAQTLQLSVDLRDAMQCQFAHVVLDK